MKGIKEIFIGADHRGFKLKTQIAGLLKRKRLKVVDVGTFSEEPCDYPLVAFKVGKETAKSPSRRGILICKTGIGDAIAANKVKGVRAALCYNLQAARLSRLHNNANVLVLGADFVNETAAKKIISVWLRTQFDGGRHLRRINQIREFERR